MSAERIRKPRTFTRNRCPCQSCQASKRKCDQARPQCSRCRKNNLVCEPSARSAWRVKTIRDSYEKPTTARRRAQSDPPLNDQSNPSSNDQPDPPSEEHVEQARESNFVQHEGESDVVRPDDESNKAGASSHTTPMFDPPPFPPTPTSGYQLPFYALPWSDLHLEDPSTLVFTPSQLNSSSFGPFPSDMTFWIPSLDSGNTAAHTTPLPSGVGGTSEGIDVSETLDGSPAADTSVETPIRAPIDMSDELVATVESVIASINQSEPLLSQQRSYFHSLWDIFVVDLAPSLTAFGKRSDNPFLKHLVPKAEKTPSLLVAVLYLAQIISRRSRQDPAPAQDRFLVDKADQVLQKLEHDDAFTPDVAASPDREPPQAISSFTIIMVFCMAFVASHDANRLIYYMEYAAIICQGLFKTHAEDEDFLYLTKLLGFMQNSLLFSTSADSISAPDYLGVALEFHDQNSDVLREIDGQTQHRVHFRDLDMFSGMSASMASIVYALGTLIKRKKVGLRGVSENHGEVVRAFESDMDGLEARLRRHLILLTKGRELRAASRVSRAPADIPLTECLNSYNEAVFWSAWTIFLTDLKDRSVVTDMETRDSVERILEACAEVPKQSVAAPLLLFPLAVGGMRTDKKVYREFVSNRLESLRHVGLTDSQSLRDDLERWWDSDRPTDSPIPFTNHFVF